MKAVMYHYVRQSDPELPYFQHLLPEDFKNQLDYFEEHFGFLSQADFLRSLKTGIPKDGIVLTFDDGFKDHYQYVLPCLKKRGLWGIFYIPTGVYSSGKLLDVHRIHLLLGKHGGEAVFNTLKSMALEEKMSHSHIKEFKTLTYGGQKSDEYTKIVKKILNYYIDYRYRESVIDELMRRFLLNEKILASQFYLTVEEVQQMQSAGMIIGSHSVSHRVMSKLTRDDQEKEIRESFDFLEQTTNGLTLRTFCYPYGGFYSFTEETEKLLEKNGCAFSFNVEPKDINSFYLKGRPQALPRYDCNQFPYGSVRNH